MTVVPLSAESVTRSPESLVNVKSGAGRPSSTGKRSTSKRRAVGIVRVSRVGDRDGERFVSPSEQRERIASACDPIAGFFLLKPGKPQAEESDGEEGAGATAAPRGSGGTAVVQPLSDDLLQGLGLAGHDGGYDGGGDGGGDGGQTFSLSGDVVPASAFPTTSASSPLPAGGDYGGYVPGSGQITSYDSGAVYQPGSSTPLSAGTVPTAGQSLAQ